MVPQGQRAPIALALFAPNVIWNAQHGFPTVKHTEANIGWQYPYIHPLRLLEYVGVQFGVFGPIRRASLLSPRHADAALCLAVGAHAQRPLRDDAAVHAECPEPVLYVSLDAAR